jgi:hypothetical protein
LKRGDPDDEIIIAITEINNKGKKIIINKDDSKISIARFK